MMDWIVSIMPYLWPGLVLLLILAVVVCIVGLARLLGRYEGAIKELMGVYRPNPPTDAQIAAQGLTEGVNSVKIEPGGAIVINEMTFRLVESKMEHDSVGSYMTLYFVQIK